MDNGRRNISQVGFEEILFAILLVWILVELWTRFIENFSYTTLGLDKRSSYHSFIVAAVVTVIFILYLLFDDQIWSDISTNDLINI